MSHEGVRFVSEDEARRVRATERELPREAVEPLHVRVNKTEGTGVEIDWKDGHSSRWTFAWLRDACPCATCVEERKVNRREPGEPKAQPPNLLPMFKPPIRPKEVRAVGHYAISFDWNDGHTSGIYSWHYLRESCQCSVCMAEKAAAESE